MMKRRNDDDVDILSVRSRIGLFHNTTLQASKAIMLSEEAITYDLMIKHGVKTSNIVVSGLSPTQLKARGVDTAYKMKSLGFDALYLTNPTLCNQMMMAFGREQVLEIFLAGPEDAVAIAGSEATSILNISTSELLSATIGSPSHAVATLQQLPRGKSLSGVSGQLLLDAGLRLSSLAKCGYTVESLIENTHVSPIELNKLGFQVT